MTTYDRILWWIILVLAILCAALWTFGAEITQGAGAKALLAGIKTKATPRMDVEVSWVYKESPYHWRSNMTFYVWRKDFTDRQWRLANVTTGTNFTDAWRREASICWYAVAASNTVTEQVTWLPK